MKIGTIKIGPMLGITDAKYDDNKLFTMKLHTSINELKKAGRSNTARAT